MTQAAKVAARNAERHAQNEGIKKALRATGKSQPVLEGGKLVGHYGLTWNYKGTAQVLVFIPC